jgi:zinc transport system permease protein
MEMLDLMQYGFIQRAFLAGALIAVLCSTLGVFLVLRRLSLIGDGLAHVAFGGVAVGLLLRTAPLYAAIPIVLLSGLGIMKLTEKTRVYADTSIGIVSAIGIAGGVLIASASGGFNIDLFSYLFGNILTISAEDVALSGLLSGCVILVIVLFYHELRAVSFDEELARVSGIRTSRINMLLVALTALTVVLAIKIVGTMLVSALLILPAAIALQSAKSFTSAILLSSAVGVITVLVGIMLSCVLNLPSGGTIIMLNVLVFAAMFLMRLLLGRGNARG